MNKEEILNDDFVEKEVAQPKSHKKIKIAIAIAASLAIIATTTLLVGYFKFDWFKSEIYKLDAKISRNVYQANYFTETRTINTRMGFTSGVSENHEQVIYTNFMVLQTDKKELENNDFLNTATLVILDAKMKNENELKEVTSFNIFDENKVNEVKSNPNGAKYPMAVFSFYENGTVADIQLPNNMDDYNAQTIIELIGNVVPRLSRNRTEDISNGLTIDTKKDNKKRTLVESIAPQEIPEYRQSKFVKSIERVIENEQLTNIRTKSNLDLVTVLEEDESAFGIKEFKYETKSNIVSTAALEDKQNAELVKKLAEYYTFIDGRDLLKELAKKEQEKDVDRYEITEDNVDPQLRNLLSFKDFNTEKTYTIKTFNVCGKSVSIKVKLGVKSGKVFGDIIISAGGATATFGTSGITASYSKTWSGELTLFRFNFPPMPAIGIALKAGGSVKVSASLSTASKKLTVSISASLYAKAEVKAGFDAVASIAAGAKGTIVGASISGTLTTSKGITKSGSLYAGQVVVYIDFKALFGLVKKHKEWKVFDGWSKSF